VRGRWFCFGLVSSLMLAPVSAVAEELSALFDEAIGIVEEQFYDPSMGGPDWEAAVAAARKRIAGDMDRQGFAGEVNRLLRGLNASHTYLLTRDDLEWYHLAGVFIDGYTPLREALKSVIPDGAPVYSGIGVMIEQREAGYFVTGVLAGFPAKDAGVLVGDRIVSVESKPFHPIRSFVQREGVPTSVTLERRPGEKHEVKITPVPIDGRSVFERAMVASAQVLPRKERKIGYIRLWSYAGEKYQSALVRELTNGTLRGADALVLDLRGGLGGASPSYLNFFTPTVVEAASTDRNGETLSFTSGWNRPVVLLVDERSRSGKELFAFGFRALKKGPIVGERTAGEVLAGRINGLSDGSLLYVASADVRIGGQRLEGNGVEPDIVVPFEPAYAAGYDPQLERALAVAVEQIECKAGKECGNASRWLGDVH